MTFFFEPAGTDFGVCTAVRQLASLLKTFSASLRNRIASRWTLDYDPPAQLVADPHYLPLPESTFDLLVLPHALEFTDDPHRLLREAYRVVRPEGQIVIAGFNPEQGALVVVPTREGQRGNPVLWSRRFFPDLMAIEGDYTFLTRLASFVAH